MQAVTFDDNRQIEVQILSKPSSTGLCKVKHGARTLVRHRTQLSPIDKEAKELLGK